MQRIDYSVSTLPELQQRVQGRGLRNRAPQSRAACIKILERDDAKIYVEAEESAEYSQYVRRTERPPIPVPLPTELLEYDYTGIELFPDSLLPLNDTTVPQNMTASQFDILRNRAASIAEWYLLQGHDEDPEKKDRFVYFFKTVDGRFVRIELDPSQYLSAYAGLGYDPYHEIGVLAANKFVGTYTEYETIEVGMDALSFPEWQLYQRFVK